jgi:hypothetical protein
MNKKLLFKFIVSAAAILTLVYGFGTHIDDGPTTVPGNNIDPVSYNSTGYKPVDGILAASWSAGANVITPRLAGIGITYMRNDTGWLYMMGGDLTYTGSLTATNERYNVNADNWVSMAQIPTAIQYLGGARLGDTIYTIAGLTSSYFSSATNVVSKYYIMTNTWTTAASTPEALACNRTVGYQDSLIYSAGGVSAGGSNATNAVYLYNARNNTWRTATPLPQTRCLGAFTVKGDTLIYVGGGTTYFAGYNQTTYVGIISQSNRSQINWGTGSNYPGTSGYRFDAAPWGCKGVIIDGGTNTTFGSSTECYSYSSGNNLWTIEPSLTHAVGSSHTGSVIYSSGRMKLISASGEQYPATPYTVLYTQVLTDTCFVVPIPLPVPFCEGFGLTLFPPAGWSFVYMGNLYWLRKANVSGFGYGTGSAFYNCWYAPSGTNEDLITPYFSSITLATDSLFFEYAYSPYPVNPPYSQDSLIVRGSTNNGITWSRLAGYGPYELQTAPSQGSQFVPNSSQWGIKRVSLPMGTNKINFHGVSGFGNDIYVDSICVKHPVGIKPEESNVPRVYSLSQNYPNPFNPSTMIKYAIPHPAYVEIKIYDILGREVEVIVNDFKQTGIYSVTFDASNLASGVYLYRMKSNDFTDTKKMLLLK